MRSALLRYLEEAMAESYAQVRAQGFCGVIEGVRFPLKGNNPYISIQERAAIRGQFLGTIVVDGQVMTVSLEYGPAQATSPQQNRQETTGAPAR